MALQSFTNWTKAVGREDDFGDLRHLDAEVFMLCIGARYDFDDLLLFHKVSLSGAETYDQRERSSYLFHPLSKNTNAVAELKRRLHENLVRKMQRNADALTIVAIWATAEKKLNEILKLYQQRIRGKQWNGTHIWGHLEPKLVALGVDLLAIPHFSDFNLCRLINNAYKHGDIVDGPLEASPEFAAHAGEEIPIDHELMQRFLIGCWYFFDHLCEHLNTLLPAGFTTAGEAFNLMGKTAEGATAG